MKRFVLLAHGPIEHSPAFQAAHRAWWDSLQGHVIDPGNPLVNGRSVTKDGQVTALAVTDEPALGYSIIEAETLEQALSLVAHCPMDMWVYEAAAM